MKNTFLILIFALFTVACSKDSNNDESPLKEYEVTVRGVIDGNYSNYPDPTDLSFTASYISDKSTDNVVYTESSTNELIIEKTKNVKARNNLGLQLKVNQAETILYYLEIEIKDVEADNVVYNGKMDKTLVYSDADFYSTTKIKVLYNIQDENAILEIE